jgi:hypothetical protein
LPFTSLNLVEPKVTKCFGLAIFIIFSGLDDLSGLDLPHKPFFTNSDFHNRKFKRENIRIKGALEIISIFLLLYNTSNNENRAFDFFRFVSQVFPQCLQECWIRTQQALHKYLFD